MDTVVHILSKTLWFVVRPGTFALILACIGLALMWRGRRWGRWPLLAGLGFYVVVLATPVAPWIVMPLEDRFARPVEPPAHVDGVIVLGGAVDQNLTEARGIPALNGAASMSQRTGGFRSPPSTAPLTTFRTAATGEAPVSGVNPMSRMYHHATTRVTPSMAERTMYGTPRFVSWAMKPPRTEPA